MRVQLGAERRTRRRSLGESLRKAIGFVALAGVDVGMKLIREPRSAQPLLLRLRRQGVASPGARAPDPGFSKRAWR